MSVDFNRMAGLKSRRVGLLRAHQNNRINAVDGGPESSRYRTGSEERLSQAVTTLGPKMAGLKQAVTTLGSKMAGL